MSSTKKSEQTTSKLERMREREQRAEAGGGAERVARQHAAGKLTARERINFLLHEGTFAEPAKHVVPPPRDFGLDTPHSHHAPLVPTPTPLPAPPPHPP